MWGIAPSGGRLDNCWDISCEKSRFYAKKSYFFPILGEARAGCSPLDPPLQYMTTNYGIQVVQRLCQSMRMTTEKNVLKAIYWFHILCFNRATHNYWLWYPVLIRYRMRNKNVCLC